MEIFSKYLWIIFVCIIGVIFLLLISSFWKKVNATLNRLKATNQEIKPFTQQTDDSNQHAVLAIKDIISKNTVLEEHFKHFYASCIQENGNFYATHKIEDYINIKKVFKPNRVYDDGAGILTGAGLLLTFGAITVGLSHLDLTSTNTTVIQNGIGNLISGLTAKFSSSIAGILAALIYTLIRPKLLHLIELEIDDFSKQINKIFKFKYPEQMLYPTFRTLSRAFI